MKEAMEKAIGMAVKAAMDSEEDPSKKLSATASMLKEVQDSVSADMNAMFGPSPMSPADFKEHLKKKKESTTED